jgi:hypothetical protein
VYSAVGYVGGFAASLFFRKRSFISFVGAGTGCGYAFNKNRRHFNKANHH